MVDLGIGRWGSLKKRLSPGLVILLMGRPKAPSGWQYTETSLSVLGSWVEWVSVSTPQKHLLQVRALVIAIRHVTPKAGSGGWQRWVLGHSEHEIQVKYNCWREQAVPRQLLGYPLAFWPYYLISPTWAQTSMASALLSLVPSSSEQTQKFA